MNERHSSKCPCGLKKLYSECCGQYHSGQAAPTAEALMRSRYSAYTLNNVDYIIDTTWPCQQVALKKDRAVLEANNTSWVRLDIVKTEAGNPSDHQGKVEFIAWYTEPPASTEKALHEISDFVKEGNRWFYIHPGLEKSPAIKNNTIGRNDLCFCGSGRKFKKCCMK